MAAKQPEYQHSFRHPIDKLGPKDTVLDKFPELAVYEALLTHGFGPEKDGLLRYVIYLSEGSGLTAAIPDLELRRKEALRLAGVPPSHPRYKAALDLSDEACRDMWFAWLEAFSSREHYAFSVLEAAYNQTCRKVATPIPDNDDESKTQRSYQLREDLGRSLRSQCEELLRLEGKLFGGSDEMKRIAAERTAPAAKRGSLEDLVLGKNK